MSKVFLRLLAATLPILVGAEARAQDATPPMLANPCLVCHAPGQSEPDAIPGLDGLSAEQIKSAMLDFKQGKRSATIMDRIARGYSDEQIDAIARYLGWLDVEGAKP